MIENVGLQTPESVLYDPLADLYLVANINGQPTKKDNNGFISRITPDGKVQDLKWIAGGANAVTLNAPKGMGLTADRLWVTDINVVRGFDRVSGLPVDSIPVPGAGFLNDLTVGADDALYVSDMATDEIIRITLAGEVSTFNSRPLAVGPNGVSFRGDALWVTVSSPDRLCKLNRAGDVIAEIGIPGGGLDGLICLNDGGMLVSSWSESSVFMVNRERHVAPIIRDLPSPADIGYDSKRNAVLIPLFRQDAVRIDRLP
ncbi:MAG: hypothetical protein GY835_15445 [bacterium]|nr:hypothetical protein [bacterium]